MVFHSTSALRAAAALAVACVAALPAPAQAADSLHPSGWLCTTSPVPTSSGTGTLAERRAGVLEGGATFYGDGQIMMLRLSRAVPPGTRINRTGGGLGTKDSVAPCVALGYRDQGLTKGRRLRYAIDAAGAEPATFTVGHKLSSPKDRGRVVLVIEQSTWAVADFRSTIDDIYSPDLRRDGWTPVVEVVDAAARPSSVREQIRRRVQEDPARTRTAFLIGRVPVPYAGNRAWDGVAAHGGAWPTDSYYADLDGAWTDTSVNTTAPERAEHDNVPGDGKLDQNEPPSARELAIGRLDFSRLPGAEMPSDALGAEWEELARALWSSASSRQGDFSSPSPRLEGFVIDGGPAASDVRAGFRASDPIGAASAGTRADLDEANGWSLGGFAQSQPEVLYERGLGTPSSLTSAATAPFADIAGPANPGKGRFVVSAGGDVADWDRADSLLRARLLARHGAQAATHHALDTSGLAIGDSLGESFGAGLADPTFRAWSGAPANGTLFGDPTTRLRWRPSVSEARGRPGNACQDVLVSFDLVGAPGAFEVQVFRSIDGSPMSLVGTQYAGNASGERHDRIVKATYVDQGVAAAHRGKTVQYELRPRALHLTRRGSFWERGESVRTAAVRAHCAWTCEEPTVNPGGESESRRTAQLETAATFSPDGRQVSIALTRRDAGRDMRGVRLAPGVADEPGAPGESIQTCTDGLAASAFVDADVIPGQIFEYRLDDLGYMSRGERERPPIRVGANLPARHDRGRLLLVVERTLGAAPVLAGPLARYEEALRGDGWQVVRMAADRTATPAAIRAEIRAEYDRDRARTNTVVLLGHVPVPYSGTAAWDGHSNDHKGAWSTDAPYADIDGPWTDTAVNITDTAARNRNVPGDGRYDQNSLPSAPELAVGRIDLSDLPAIARPEAQLTAEYLERDIRYRRGELPFRPEAYTTGIGSSSGELHNVSPVVGASAVRIGQPREQVNVTTVDGRLYFIAQTSGSGSNSSQAGVGTTVSPPPTLFLGAWGSYFGDWDNRDNYLRAHLVRGLGARFRDWGVDGLALGETVGETVRVDQLLARRGPHIASFLGDPTLRAYPLRGVGDPVAHDEVSAVGACRVVLGWSASQDSSVAGVHVDRRVDGGPLERLTEQPLSPGVTSFQDPRPLSSSGASVEYVIRPVGHQVTARGSFDNLGQGSVVSGEFGRCD